MRDTTLDIFTAKEKTRLLQDIGALVNASQFRVPIVLGKLTQGAYDPNTGTQSETWTRDKVYAIRGEFSVKELSYFQGNIELGDVLFLINKSDYLNDLGADLDKEDELLEFRYDTGGINITKGSTAVTGLGTSWLKNAGKSDYLRVKYETDYYSISSVSTNTALVLGAAYSNATKTSAGYEVYHKWRVVNVMKDVMDIIRKVHCRRVK